MGRSTLVVQAVRTLAVFTTIAGSAAAAFAEPLQFAGASCVRPPEQHCPDSGCAAQVVTSGGAVVETKTGRTYFLDYPCDLKRGEKVTFILSLHGGGSYGNWQRHYFPILDYADKYRLVIATPFSPRRVWSCGRRRLSAEHRDERHRADWSGEHQGVLAGGTLARRPDVHAPGLQRLFQDQGRWIPQPVRWPRRWSGRPRRQLRRSRRQEGRQRRVAAPRRRPGSLLAHS